MKELQEIQPTAIKLPSVAAMKKVLLDVKDIPLVPEKEAIILDLINKMADDPYPENRALVLNQLIKELKEIIDCLNDTILKDNTKFKERSQVLQELIQIQAQGMHMFKSLTNIWTNVQSDHLTRRNSNVWLDRQNKNLKTEQVFSMHGGERQKAADSNWNVKYMDDLERAPHRVFIDNGLLKTFEVIGTGEDRQVIFKKFDTTNMCIEGVDTYCIYVVSPKGELYACDAPNISGEKIKHSSFLGGEAVSYAGTMNVVNGKVMAITDSSGHYMPPNLEKTELGKLLSKSCLIDKNTVIGDTKISFGRVSFSTANPEILKDRPFTIPDTSTELSANNSQKCLNFKKNIQAIKIESLDIALADYHKCKEDRSRQDNIALLTAIKTDIETVRKQHPDKTDKTDRAIIEQVTKIEIEVIKGLKYFEGEGLSDNTQEKLGT